MFGANESAVPGGGFLQLRALDWNVDGTKCSTTFIPFVQAIIL